MRPISTRELNFQLGNGDHWRLVDVRDAGRFRQAHLPEALSVPLADSFATCIQQLVPERSVPVVLYGTGPGCPLARQAARVLHALGYDRVHVLAGGLADWRAAGLPVESGEPIAMGETVAAC